MSTIKLCGRLSGWGAVLLLLTAALGLTGCRSEGSKKSAAGPSGIVPGAAGSATAPETSGLEPPVFRAGDALTVSFADLPSQVPPFQAKIKEDGTITLLLNQTFTAAGKTRGALEKEIRDCYVPRYYKYMTVTITVEAQTLFYYVDGEVRTPNRQIYVSRITVLKAIASAGGFTEYANKKKVKLIRLDGRKATVNCVKAIDIPNLDLEIYPGDKIYVPRKIL
jgi:protein involved in polysaccharide export with SLBB domain